MLNFLRAALVASALLITSPMLHARSNKKYKEKSPTWALSDVIVATETALNGYQTYSQSPDGIKDGLPPLAAIT